MRRGRLEKIISLLTAIKEHPNYSKTRLIAVANWSAADGANVLRELNRKGFCKPAPNGHTWILSEKSKDFLNKIKPVIRELRIET